MVWVLARCVNGSWIETLTHPDGSVTEVAVSELFRLVGTDLLPSARILVRQGARRNADYSVATMCWLDPLFAMGAI